MADPAPAPAPAPDAAPAPAPAPTAWHVGVEPEVIGFWQNKGYDITDAKKVATELTKHYREAEKFIGAPASEMLRIPKPNAPEADLKAFWSRLGAVDDPKAIDLSTVKNAAGQPIDEKLAETIAATAVAARAPKEAAVALASAVVKHLDGLEAEAIAIKTGRVNEEMANLKKNWGGNYDANMFVAKNALAKVAQAAGLAPDKAKEAADALSTVAGIGAAHAAEMWRIIGTKIGEDKFVTMGGTGAGNLPMTREAAKAEIAALKGDPQFAKRLMDGGAVERQRWDALHAIGFGEAA